MWLNFKLLLIRKESKEIDVVYRFRNFLTRDAYDGADNGLLTDVIGTSTVAGVRRTKMLEK